MTGIAAQLLWPPLCPWNASDPDRRAPWWRACCGAAVLPVAAILHQVVFYRHACMLNCVGPDYSWDVVARWLARDPSLPWAIVALALLHLLGGRAAWMRLCVAPVFASFVPVALWVWDLPGSGRIVCRTLHDGRYLLPGGQPLRSVHVYAASGLIFLLLVAGTWYRGTARRGAPS